MDAPHTLDGGPSSTSPATTSSTVRICPASPAACATRRSARQIHVLENDEVVIDGVRFLGCSLWSDFDFAGPQNREQLDADLRAPGERLQADPRLRAPSGLCVPRTRVISTSPAALGWRLRLAQHHDGPTVVVTHHAP